MGDSGYFVNLELWSQPQSVFGGDSLRFLVFHDFGDSYNHTLLPGEDPSVDLSSVGCGLRYEFQPDVSIRVDYGWQTAEIANLPDPRERVHIGVVVSR